MRTFVTFLAVAAATAALLASGGGGGGGLFAGVAAADVEDLPVDFGVYTKGSLARSITAAESFETLGSWKEQWAAATVPGYADASPLAKYAVDGRGRFWISNSDSAVYTVVFEPYKWVHTKYPWDASVIYLTRKSHMDFLRMYHEDDDNVEDYPYLMNRVENSRALTDKVNLQETLGTYTIPGRGSGTLLQTPTHIIRDGEECRAFLEKWATNKDRTWVHKLASESQGKGIAFFPPTSDKPPCNESSPDFGDGIVLQSHIDYPLTLSGKKSEIRAYWVVVSVEPLIVLMYHSGTTRLATNDYIPPSKSTLDDWGNPLVHILNTRQQKDANPDYHLTAGERKRSWAAIPKALREEGRLPEGLTDDQWIRDSLLPVINRTIHTLARAAQPHLAEANVLGDASRRFELFGLDVIFEDVAWREREGAPNNLGDGGGAVEPGGLKVWVTEAQVGPGLSLDSPTKIDVLPAMLTEMFNVVLEIDNRRHRGERLDNIDDLLDGFQVVINDATPEWRMKGAGYKPAPPPPARAGSDAADGGDDDDDDRAEGGREL